MERIGRAIKMGLLRPSERLPSERDLALQLALSRSTVREALRVLAEAGYLEARRGRGGGTFVAEVLPQLEARDPHDVLRELGSTARRHPGACAACSRSGRPSWRRSTPPVPTVERLAELIDEVAEFDAGSYPSYRAVDSRLHIAIAAISGSLQLVEAITETHGVISDVMNGMPRSNETLDNSTGPAPSAARGDREPRPRRRAGRDARARGGHRAPHLRSDPGSDESARRALRDRLRRPARHPPVAGRPRRAVQGRRLGLRARAEGREADQLHAGPDRRRGDGRCDPRAPAVERRDAHDPAARHARRPPARARRRRGSSSGRAARRRSRRCWRARCT